MIALSQLDSSFGVIKEPICPSRYISSVKPLRRTQETADLADTSLDVKTLSARRESGYDFP